MDTPTLLAVVSIVLTALVLVVLVVVLVRQGRQERAIRELERRAGRTAQVLREQQEGAPGDGEVDGLRRTANIAVVMNPSKHRNPEAFREHVQRVVHKLDAGTVRFYDTTREDPGQGQTQEAVVDGADLVIAAGGDGTVRMVASVLANSGTRMGIIPLGTGNLLARNLEIPLDDLEAALVAALTGRDKKIDVGWLRVGRSDQDLEVAERSIFLVISGIGADAEVIGATNDTMKKRIGWIAYVLAGLDKVIGHSYEVELTFDGGDVQLMKARTVLIGNVGRLPAGIVLMPEATIDNERLEIMAMNWRGAAGLSQILTQVVNPRVNARPKLSMMERRLTTGIRVVASKPQPVQIDGDTEEAATHLVAEVDPGALLVRIPPER